MRSTNQIAVMALMVPTLFCPTSQGQVFIETVGVGNKGNANDTHWAGRGCVDCVYHIGKYEVTNSQYAEFLNWVATVGDPYGLYNVNMGGGWNNIGGILRSGSGTEGDPWVYAARPNRGNRPVNYVSWYDALRFANWMHNGRGSSDTEDGAYDMSLGASVFGKSGATWVLPSEDEWYKAAYYKRGGTNTGYWDYPTRSDTAPTAEAPPGTDLVNGSANYLETSHADYVDPTYYTREVGAYDAKPSDSAYGTFDQGRNLFEWNEADYGGNDWRGARGGSFGTFDIDGNGWSDLHADNQIYWSATYELYYIGFRVARVRPPFVLNPAGPYPDCEEQPAPTP